MCYYISSNGSGILKKVFIVIIFLALIFYASFYFKKDNTVIRLLSEFEEFKQIVFENIEKVEIAYYREGGDSHDVYTETDDIRRIYNSIGSIKLGRESGMSCEDNSDVFIFYLTDGTHVSFEKECDVLVFNKKKYEIIKGE